MYFIENLNNSEMRKNNYLISEEFLCFLGILIKNLENMI